jgi:SAM-dependent methyltransferase
MEIMNKLRKTARQRLGPSAWENVKVLRERLATLARYDITPWIRITQNRSWDEFLQRLHVKDIDMLEISPAENTPWKKFKFRSYTSVDFPEFDITKDVLSRNFDLIIADQVFEHVTDPLSAAINVYKMLRDDGYFLIATPFLIRIHSHPGDYYRWTPDGLRSLLESAGFSAEATGWGNRKVARAHLEERWVSYGWGKDLRNETLFPVNVWAFAHKRC